MIKLFRRSVDWSIFFFPESKREFSRNFEEFSPSSLFTIFDERFEEKKKRKSLEGNATRKLIYSANANNVDEDSIRPWRVE